MIGVDVDRRSCSDAPAEAAQKADPDVFVTIECAAQIEEVALECRELGEPGIVRRVDRLILPLQILVDLDGGPCASG
jgi:hypothetical protein